MMTDRFSGRADAGEARTQMMITASVVDSVSVRFAYQASTLTISDYDVARGFVWVRGASRFQVEHDGPYVLEFRPSAALFTSFTVTAPGFAAEFGPEGGTLQHRRGARDSAPLVFDYRFQLAANARPGAYAWPVTVTVLPH